MTQITNLGHSGFSVETDTHFLIFDYSEGVLPTPPETKTTLVFVSHHHPDHFNPEIFSLKETVPNVHYYISDDIYESRVRRYIDSGYTMVHPMDDLKISARFRLKVLPSTDCGVAYLVCLCGKNYFHAGDLNLWLWDTMSEPEAYSMVNAFEKYTSNLKNFIIDYAFLPLDTRLGIYSYLGFDYYMKHFKIQHAIPMHFFGSPRITRELIESPISLKYRSKIITLDPGNRIEQ